MTTTILVGDVRERLNDIPDASVQCVVTSPPYMGLRDYGTATWNGGDPDCDHKQGRPGAGRADGIVDERSQRNRDGVGSMGGDCGKCGAVRIDSQIGLEPTLAEYIAAMVEVFRGVKRVLRDDGCVWLNIGDSYTGGKTGRDDQDRNQRNRWSGQSDRPQNQALTGPSNSGSRPVPAGMKPKDLMMVPARLAIALQEPYYTGRIKNEIDRVWLAAMIDAEGCMFIHKRKIGQSNGQGYSRKADSYGSGLEISNTSESIVQRCLDIAGVGSICRSDKDRRQPLYRWNLRSNECRQIVREIYPYLVGKKHQARLLIGCPSSGVKADAAHQGMMLLHNGSETTIDFPEPASMYEPGWFLRSDIVWTKKNPMPESVTDRCTSAHEHIFLLTKSARYYYDQEAVRESVSEGTHGGAWTEGGQKQTALGQQIGGRLGNSSECGTRNLRNVWEIATQPFSGAKLLADYVGRDGKPYKVSPSCPVHGLPEFQQVQQTGECDEQQDPQSIHMNGTDDHHAEGQRAELSANEPTTSYTTGEESTFGHILQSNLDHKTPSRLPYSEYGQPDGDASAHRTNHSANQSMPQDDMTDLMDLPHSQTATPSSTQIHRTDPALATIPPYTASAQTSIHIDGTLASLALSDSDESTTENNTSLGDLLAHPSAQTKHHRSGKSSRHQPPECNCSIVNTDHFATFPLEIPRRCIKAGTSEKGCCSACGAPWARVVERESVERGESRHPTGRNDIPYGKVPGSNTRGVPMRAVTDETWQPGCTCDADVIPCTVLDPFLGAGTTLLVADQLGRNGIGIELNPEYAQMAKTRITGDAPMFARVEVDAA